MAKPKADLGFHTSEGTTVEGMQTMQRSMEKKVNRLIWNAKCFCEKHSAQNILNQIKKRTQWAKLIFFLLRE